MKIMIKETVKRELIEQAKKAAQFSYAPYSRFKVGAALLCGDGTIIRGCNVENRSYGLTNCAERSALFTAITGGRRQFNAIAIYSPESEEPLPPCGACRQVLSEFGEKELIIIMVGKKEVIIKTLGELLPLDSLHDLKEKR